MRAAEAEAAEAAADEEGRVSASKTTAEVAATVGIDPFKMPPARGAARGAKSRAASSMRLEQEEQQPPAATAGAAVAAAPKPAPPKEYETLPLESELQFCSPEQAAVIKGRYGNYVGQRVISTSLPSTAPREPGPSPTRNCLSYPTPAPQNLTCP